MNKTIRWLWQVPGKKKRSVCALTLIQAAAGGLGVLYALLLRGIVDSAMNRQPDLLRRNVLLIVGLVVLQLALSALIRWLRELGKSDLENSFKQRLVDGILWKDYGSVSATHTAEWLNRLTNDTAVVAGGYVEVVPGLAGMAVRLVSALVMILVLDRWFAYILFPGAALMILLTYGFRRVLKRLHKNIQESDGRLRVFLQERIGSLMLIRSFAGEEQTAREAEANMQAHKVARMKRNRFSNFCNIGFGAAMEGMKLVGLVYCAYGIMTGRVSYGTLTAIMHLIGQIQAPLANISGYLPRWYAMLASAERLMEIEDYADDRERADASTVRAYYEDRFRALGLRDASFTYRPAADEEMPIVLEGVDLQLRKGEYVAFTGHSGCGKSTVLKLLMCMYPLDSGLRYIDDRELTPYYRRLFGYVPQGNVLMNGTIREIVSFAEPSASRDEERLKRALRTACADEFVEDLDAVLGERGSGLSEGQMQRIAIARAVFSEAPILLLDEATSALDEGTEKLLLENLHELTDRTVVFVTHRKAALSICDRVLLFTENGIVEQT